MKGMIQENFWIGGQRSPNETPMQERSPSEPERSPNVAEDSERITGIRKDTQKQKRSPNGARAKLERRNDSESSAGLRKDVRGPETTLFRDCRIFRHSSETQL